MSKILDPETRSELSSGSASMSLLASSSLYGSRRTVSEIHPDNSASCRRSPTGDAEQEQLWSNSIANDNVRELESIVTLRSSEEGSLYRVIGGRAYNSSSGLYVLPADDAEHSRLDMQHFSLCLAMNSLFPFQSLVKFALRQGQEVRPQVLDMGTGSGRWAVDMAMAFTWSDVVGIDLVPPVLVSEDKLPPNCRFEVDDANLSMKHYANTFSLVHARWIETGINDAESFLYEMARILKPGGLLILGAGDAQIWDEELKPLPFVPPGEPGFTWSQWLKGNVFRAHWNRGCTAVNATLWWNDWLDVNPNYSEVYAEDVYEAIGPWKENLDERQTYAANLKRGTILQVFAAWKRLLLADGVNEDDIDQWLKGSKEELEELSIHSYNRARFIAAVRSDGPFEERGMPTEVNLASRCHIKGMDLTDDASSARPGL